MVVQQLVVILVCFVVYIDRSVVCFTLLCGLHFSQFSHSVMSDSVTPWTAACQASLSITNSWSLHELMSIKSVMPSSHLILCHPLLLTPSIFPSITVFSNESVLHIRWPKYWSFSFIISPSNEYSGLISFRIDWLDLLAVQGTLKSLLQHHSSKSSILQCSSFFIVQLSRPYMTTGKTIALTRWTYICIYIRKAGFYSSVQVLSHVRLCNPMNRSMPGLPVHHQLLESTQTHVHE